MTTTHANLIDTLGGGQKVAEDLNALLDLTGSDKLGRDAVYKWKQENRIPYRWRDGIRALAAQGGFDLPPDLRPLGFAEQPQGDAAA